MRWTVFAAVSLFLAAGAIVAMGPLSITNVLFAQDAHHDAHDDHDGHAHEKDDHDGHDGHAGAGESHYDHDGHAHEEGDHERHGNHAGHGHGEGAHDDHADELEVKLTTEKMERFGIRLATAGAGKIGRQVRLPGEIVLNGDRVVHVVPPAAGIVRAVQAKVGDPVATGQELLTIESAELSETKTEYLAKLTELTCCAIDLARAETLSASAKQLLAALAKSPGLDEIRSLKLPAMGEKHSAAIAAYADLVFARSEYEREKRLVADDVSSKAEYQTAASAYKRATAAFIAARDVLAFETQRALLEARQARQVLELELAAATRKLSLLGLTAKEIDSLKTRTDGSPAKHDCDDPNCTDCEGEATVAGGEEDDHHHHEDRLGLYSLRAPFGGIVVEKHAAQGEQLADDESVFVIADLSSVWVDLSVYQKDLPFIRKGQVVHISIGNGAAMVEGKIAFVSPTVDPETRTAKARIVLPNPKGVYRPGLFVTGEVDVSEALSTVVVPKAAVLRIENKSVVFVPEDDGLVAQQVRLGRSSRTHVEILDGLGAGQKYVAVGAFKLKAKIVTSGLGAHAGHGH
jgi:RND family efflux transporter MFP subunit